MPRSHPPIAELEAGAGCWSFLRQFKVLHVVVNHVKMLLNLLYLHVISEKNPNDHMKLLHPIPEFGE